MFRLVNLKIERVGEKVKAELKSVVDTHAFADLFARAIKPGDRLSLTGDMGAGKTEFTRSLLRSLSGDNSLEVPSPTFSIVQSYELKNLNIHHFDLWRLEHPSDLLELGWEENDNDVVLVEWPDKGGDFMADADWEIELQVINEEERVLWLGAHDQTRLNEVLS